MTDASLPALLALAVYAFATGIFAVLSALEKPIWRTMRDHDAPADEGEVRRIASSLKAFIHILPPTMMTAMSLGLALLVWLLVARGFDLRGWLILGAFLALQGTITPTLLRRIEAMKVADVAGPLPDIKLHTARLAAVHHMGMGVTLTMVVLILALLAI